MLIVSNARIGSTIDGMEAGALKSGGLSGAVRTRIQHGMVGGQPATYYRISGVRTYMATPSKLESGMIFGTVKLQDGSSDGLEPVIWWFSIGTEVGKGASCLAAHTAITDLARAFPLGAGEAAVRDPRPAGPLSNLNLPSPHGK